MTGQRRKALVRSTAFKAGLGLLVAAGFLGALHVVDRAVVGASATESQVTGTLSLEPDGRIVVDDGASAYDVVGAMDLSPFLGRTVVLDGGVDDGMFYVRALALGAIELADQGGTVIFHATGTVEKTADGYQTTVEGISFTLAGGPELDRVVGEQAEIQGEVIGTWITEASLQTADGEETQTVPPQVDDSEAGDPDPCCDHDDG